VQCKVTVVLCDQHCTASQCGQQRRQAADRHAVWS